VECDGVYSREYQQFYDDGNSGCTTVKKIWEDSHKKNSESGDNSTEMSIDINCTCCSNFKTWTNRHPLDTQKLRELKFLFTTK